MIHKGSRKVEIQVRLSLTRGSGTGPDVFRLTAEDVLSGCHFLEVDIDLVSFANLMSARLTAEGVKGKLILSDRIGMVHQHKTVFVLLPPDHLELNRKERVQLLKNLAGELEEKNPGWVADDPKDDPTRPENANKEYAELLRLKKEERSFRKRQSLEFNHGFSRDLEPFVVDVVKRYRLSGKHEVLARLKSGVAWLLRQEGMTNDQIAEVLGLRSSSGQLVNNKEINRIVTRAEGRLKVNRWDRRGE